MKITITNADNHIIEQRDASADEVFDDIVAVDNYEHVRTSWSENKNGRMTLSNGDNTLVIDYQEGDSTVVCENCRLLVDGVLEEHQMDDFDAETALRNISRYLIEVSDDESYYSTEECVACETSVAGSRYAAVYYA